MTRTTTKTRVSRSASPRHGHVFQPASRAYFAWLDARLDPGALNQLESGKFFPAIEAGLRDPLAPTDETNNRPPADGQIASGGNAAALFLDEPRTDWKKHVVKAGTTFPVSWDYSARHVTRRWKYFMTRTDWQPDKPLSRSQFEELPFYQVELAEQPHWLYTEALMPPKPTEHELILPIRTGYHVLLAIWEVANTGNAFYQILDLDFIDDDDGNPVTPPGSPRNLRLDTVDENGVSFSWIAATAGSWPIAHHKLYRDGVVIALIEAGENQYMDRSVLPAIRYSYSVTGVDAKGNESKPSPTLSVVTSSSSGSEGNPPTAPIDLHSTEITPYSVTLTWLPSVGSNGVSHYIIYRDGIEIGRTSAPDLVFIDSGLVPSTRYRYFVAALDYTGKLSVPGNVLAATTSSQNSDGEDPEWAVNSVYNVGDKVIYKGKIYICLQRHTSQYDWAPEGTLSLWLPV